LTNFRIPCFWIWKLTYTFLVLIIISSIFLYFFILSKFFHSLVSTWSDPSHIVCKLPREWALSYMKENKWLYQAASYISQRKWLEFSGLSIAHMVQYQLQRIMRFKLEWNVGTSCLNKISISLHSIKGDANDSCDKVSYWICKSLDLDVHLDTRSRGFRTYLQFVKQR
jgi:hypothetical protein